MSEKRDKITLVCTSLGRNPELLQRMLNTTIGFNEIILHTNTRSIVRLNHYEEHETPFHLPIPNAYNRIIESLVETEWVCCMGDDDYFYPEDLSKMIEEVRNGIVAGVAHFNFHISGHCPPQDIRARWYGKEYILGEKKPITPKLLQKHNRLPAGSFFRKRAWEMVGGFQGDKFHDWDLWKRMAQKGIEFKYFNHLVYNHVRRENSAGMRQRLNLQSDFK